MVAICPKEKKESESPAFFKVCSIFASQVFSAKGFKSRPETALGQGTMFLKSQGQTLCSGSSDWLICGTGRWNFGGTHPLTDLAHNYSSAKTNEPATLNMKSFLLQWIHCIFGRATREKVSWGGSIGVHRIDCNACRAQWELHEVCSMSCSGLRGRWVCEAANCPTPTHHEKV